MRDPQMMRAIGQGRHLAGAAKLGRHLVHFTERPAAAGLVELASTQGRMSSSGTIPSSGGAGFCGMIDVTVVLARPGRVCTGFTSKCFSTPSGNKSSWRSRIAFAHIDERERFNHLEICVADAVGQRLTSKKVSSVVQGIIRGPRSLAL
ncbi:hypothetical protein CQ10_34170 [Bradyrhizobium valentinum]|uniref:Uncharacterized protein n=1 Tax=Bradyrhizobium valentinum TaxID=1518501 RepID=A0A0R3KF26_9BRAD|nr:hypothetical protein CQ10_34170 [Bradyrhizobium valentinum]KRQ96880.1 hypothetical protein CP49_32915 [Bradyrhizobium valentinum]